MSSSKPSCRHLVLDAGPLLSLTPLRGLAECYHTVPHVLSELKDNRAREHFEQLGLSAGVHIEVHEPDAASLLEVIQFAKKTGDYSVLSHADLCVIALTLTLERKEKAVAAEPEPPSDTLVTEHEPPKANVESTANASPQNDCDSGHDEHGENIESSSANDSDSSHNASPRDAEDDEGGHDDVEKEPLDVTLVPLKDSLPPPSQDVDAGKDGSESTPDEPLFEDPSDEDDGEGEWITPANIGLYKSQALELVPSADISDPFTVVVKKSGKRRPRKGANTSDVSKPAAQIGAGCMTADFAMQNVLLQMGLSLVGLEGKRLEKVKSWVLRCHACFKICKDNSKKFCPSCGNPTLLRTSVTASSPTASSSTPTLEVHLKKNFTYRTRGTKFSIPTPKPGSSKTGSGEGLILREDQSKYMRAVQRDEGKHEREERKMLKGALDAAKSGNKTGVAIGSWMDPDWVPGILAVGTGGKGRIVPDGRVPLGADGMPVIGYGRKNPNERRRKK